MTARDPGGRTFEPGDWVVYRTDLGAPSEAGEVVRVSDDGLVFVLYRGDRTAKATRVTDLTHGRPRPHPRMRPMSDPGGRDDATVREALRAHQSVATGLGEWACSCSPMEWRPTSLRSAHQAAAALAALDLPARDAQVRAEALAPFEALADELWVGRRTPVGPDSWYAGSVHAAFALRAALASAGPVEPSPAAGEARRVLMTAPHDGHADNERCPSCPHAGEPQPEAGGPRDQEDACSTCGGSFDSPPCSRSQDGSASGHPSGGGPRPGKPLTGGEPDA